MQQADLIVQGYESAKKQNASPAEYLQDQITPLVLGGVTSELYSLSHKLIRLFPDDENCWFCIGCYYWTVNKLDLAQKYVRRALKKNKSFAMAWILLGHIYSANEETEQALSSYRTAIRLLPNHKLPLLCLSKELIHSGNYWLAAHMLQSARLIDPQDILILNEMALIAVKLGNLGQAENILRKAIGSIDMHQMNSIAFCEVSCSLLSFLSHSPSDFLSIQIIYNYATVLRKLGHLEQALLWFERCLRLNRHKVWSLVAMGFTLHLMRR
jgi:anaphase-promoting complex subunit 6